MEIKKVHMRDSNYPILLKSIKDPPDPIYYVGDIGLASKRCVAIVGARKATEYGKWTAHKLGERLGASQVIVVSGMASGIDTCAHQGAIKTGKTIAVLGCGVNICYPPSNKKLHNQIAEEGLILSEYEPGTTPEKYMFPRRNRIISGLSEATVVVQAGNNSGALITAELASDQGRDVYAVPANINNVNHLGSNKLLKDGAMPLVVLEDLLTDMGISSIDLKNIEMSLGGDEKRIVLALLKTGEMTVDQLCEDIGLPVQTVNGIVTILEMKGIVFTALGKIFIAK